MNRTFGNTPLAGLLFLAGVLFLLPGLSGPFIFDDIPNLVQNERMNPANWGTHTVLSATLTNASGELGRPVAMLTFALNAAITGLDPFWFKLINVLIHSVNGLLIWRLLSQLGRQAGPSVPANRTFALIVALLWVTNPVSVTSTLYVVQRMNSLATTFMLLSMISYIVGRSGMIEGNTSKALRWWMCSVAAAVTAVFTKENAVLLPVYVVLMELLILKSRELASPGERRHARLFLVGSIGFAFLFLLAFSMYFPDWLNGYSSRPFTLVERLLTQPRVVLSYIEMTLNPVSVQRGLYLDDIRASKNLLDPFTTLLAIGGVSWLLVVAILLRKTRPFTSFGILFFLAGHVIESSVVPLELAFEHRTYLPSLGILLAVADLAFFALDRIGNKPHAAFVITVLACCSSAAATHVRSTEWSSQFRLVEAELSSHPNSPRANLAMGNTLATAALAKDPHTTPHRATLENLSARFLERASRLAPADPTALLILRRFALESGRDWTPQLQVELHRRLATGDSSKTVPALLSLLITCTANGTCPVAPEDVWELFTATFMNESYRGALKAELFLAAQKFALVLGRDPEIALYYSASAANSMKKSVRHRLLFVRQLVEMQRWEEADSELREASSLDKLNVYATEIDNLKSRIEQRKIGNL